MARITIDRLRHSYLATPQSPGDWALKQVDFVWEDGGAYALLGPSGCGKTTMLNIISGLVRPREGRILFDQRDVTEVPTEQRNIAQVFQFPVLYDTMTVRENLAFPLVNRGLRGAEVERRVAEVAEMLELAPLLKRRAAGLGAAEKQKISLGRGLVRSDVAAILFDEPLTVIDPQIKFDLRRKLKDVHERLRLTLVYVTHDQHEALTFADKVVVMHEGEVLQVGTPEELYERPQHTFVGYFIGSPGMNVFPCAAEGGALRFAGGALPLTVPLARRLPEGTLKIGIRPHALRLVAEATPGALPAQVLDVEDLGSHRQIDLAFGGTRFKAKLREGESLPADRVGVLFPPAATLVYAADRLVGALDAEG